MFVEQLIRTRTPEFLALGDPRRGAGLRVLIEQGYLEMESALAEQARQCRRARKDDLESVRHETHRHNATIMGNLSKRLAGCMSPEHADLVARTIARDSYNAFVEETQTDLPTDPSSGYRGLGARRAPGEIRFPATIAAMFRLGGDFARQPSETLDG